MPARYSVMSFAVFVWLPLIEASPVSANDKVLQTIVPLEFVETPVEDVLEFLSDYLKFKFELDATANGRDFPAVTATYRNQTLGHVLSKVLTESELTFTALPDRIVVRPLNPDLPLSEWGRFLRREDALNGWITLFDGRTTFGWDGATLKTGILIGGATTSAFGDYQILARFDSDGAVQLAGERVEVKRGVFRKEVRGKPGPIRLLDKTAVQVMQIHPLGLKPLFTGKDLSPWQRIDRQNLPAEKRPVWMIKDGAVLAVGGPGALEYPEKFGDFVLQVDVRTRSQHSNGGVFFRSRPGDFMNGYEAQIYNRCQENDPAHPSIWSTGSIDDRQLARRLVSRDFVPFRMTVVANGPHIATWVNGHQLIDWTDTRAPHDNPRQGLRVQPGTLQLQAHDPETDVEFLGIQIAPL